MPDSNVHKHPISYRPDIDGLRALSVLAVVIFHAFPDAMAGGFVGVDVFFVISGYLISRIIFEALDRGAFSFAEFYARRIKRIFPALLIVLVACYAAGWFTLLPDEFKQLGKHIAAGAGFVSNFVFWNEAGYFDTAADTKPLLHLWSLGIEEQFYIVWPLAIWLAWKLRLNFFVLILAVATISFALNVATVSADVVAAFYSPQTRFWELLCGSFLAWMTLRKSGALSANRLAIDLWLQGVLFRERADPGRLQDGLSLLGLSLLAFGFFDFSKDMYFPGAWALVPVLGATFFIAAGPGAWLNRALLSRPMLVWFGLISFPLYLWHWPLLSFARILSNGEPAPAIRLAAVLLAIALAWLTCRFIERPMRRADRTWLKIFVLVTLMAAIGYAGYNAYSRGGLAFRKGVVNTNMSSGDDGGDGGFSVSGCGIEDPESRKLFKVCAHDRRGPIRFALLGDSKADSLYPGLVRTSTDRGRWLFIGGASKAGSPLPLLSTDPDLASFQRPLEIAVAAIADNKEIETVVLVAAIRSIFHLPESAVMPTRANYNHKYLDVLKDTPNYQRTLDGLDRTVATFAKSGKNVVIIFDNPPLPIPRDCVARLGQKGNPDCYLPLDKFIEQTRLYRQLLDELQSRHPDHLRIFETHAILCDEAATICGPDFKGRLLYSYTDHISDYAAGLIGQRLNAFLAP